MAAELKDLIASRRVMKRQIIAFQKFFDSGNFSGASTRMELGMRTTRLEASYSDFLSGQTWIEILDSREEQLAERSAVETAYYAAISPAMVFLEAAQTNQRRTSQTSSIQGAAAYIERPNTESSIRLLPISLPEFDGYYKKWLNYRTHLIHLSIGTRTSRTYRNCTISYLHCGMKWHKSSNRWRQQLRTIYPPGSSCVSGMTTIVKWSEGTSTHYAACHQ